VRGTGIVELVAYQAALMAARNASNPYSFPSAPPFRVEHLPQPWKSELKSEAVAKWLFASPDFPLIMDMALYGADLMYRQEPWPVGVYDNMVEHEHTEEISCQIVTECQKGWMVELPNGYASDGSIFANAPIIAVDEGTKVRRITDYSNRTRVGIGRVMRGCNRLVNSEALGDAPMHRPAHLGKAFHRLRRKFPGEPLGVVVRDLSKAFRRLPVRLGHVPSLVTRWNGRTYWDLRLPFGHAASAHYCCKLTAAMASAITAHFSGDAECFAYVDDFVMIAPQHLQHSVLNLFTTMVHELGLTISQSKADTSGSWSALGEWIGFVHDVDQGSHSLSQSKLEKYDTSLQSAVQVASQGKTVSKKSLQQLVGRINHVATIFTAGRAFMRNLIEAVASDKAEVRLAASHKADLLWWKAALKTLPSEARMRRPPEVSDPLLATDASLFGFGAVLDRSGQDSVLSKVTPSSLLIAGRFSQPSVSGDMTLLEMWAVLAALQQWGPSLKSQTVRLFVDNASVEFAVRKGRSFSARVNQVLRKILLLCLKYDICVHPFHVQSSDNVTADTLSRMSEAEFRSRRINGSSFQACPPIAPHVHALPLVPKPHGTLDACPWPVHLKPAHRW